MRKLALIMMAGALTGLISMSAFAQPSSKVAVAGGDLTALSQGDDGTSIGTTSTESKLTADTGWVTVMSTSIKVPNDKGLALDVALQSALITTTSSSSKGGGKSTSEAMGSINVRVKLTHEDDPSTPLYAKPSEGTEAEPIGDLGVTYNRRMQTLEATFQGLCINDEGIVVAGDDWAGCDFETVKLVLDTLTANAFNFYYGPTVSGVYNVDVQARAQASAQIFSTNELLTEGEAIGEAFVGLGSTFIETVRLFDSGDFSTGVPEL